LVSQIPFFDAESSALMSHVCDEAWHEVQATTFFPTVKDSHDVRREIVAQVMEAIAAGEKDAARLRVIALKAAAR
jgi:hypothetical protein